MSLSAVFVAKDFAIAIADRRRTQLSSGIKFDDVRKIHQVNNDVMVTWAGICGLAEQIIDENLHLTQNSTVEDVAEIYSQALKKYRAEGVPLDDLEVTFHMAGKDHTGRYSITRVTHFEEFEPVVTYSNEFGLLWSLSRADYNPSPWLEAKIASLQKVNVEEVQRLAVELVEQVAEHDEYVSRTFDMLIL